MTERWHTCVSCYLVIEVTRPCVGRDPVRFSGRPTRGVPMDSGKFLSPTICWKSIHPICTLYGFSCRTCHLLMVAPHCLDGSYSRHTIMVVCWQRFIFYFRNVFSALCTYSNNIKEICVSSMFDYHKEKSPPILRLHCVCGGRSYGSFIFQKA